MIVPAFPVQHDIFTLARVWFRDTIVCLFEKAPELIGMIAGIPFGIQTSDIFTWPETLRNCIVNCPSWKCSPKASPPER